MASPIRPVTQPLTVPLTMGAFDCIQSTLVSDGGGGGGDLPDAPAGFAYLINADGSFVINALGAYILAKV